MAHNAPHLSLDLFRCHTARRLANCGLLGVGLLEPRIAVAVVLEGEEDQNFGGGLYSGPVVKAILQAWKDKRERPPAAPPVNFKME